jgi:transcriptional repressor NrdR
MDCRVKPGDDGAAVGEFHALSELRQPRYAGEGLAADGGLVRQRNGRRVPFDRDKLLRSVQIALRKRPVEPERIDQVVSKIVRELESQGESEVSSETVGEMVMETLRALDDVAYVRFASVYRNFREAKDFEAVLDELSGEEDPPATARK